MTPVNKKKLSDVVIDKIRRMIEDGELKIGDKLPAHSELARQLQVSRVTLREAMHTLSLLGIVEQRSGYGSVIRRPVPRRYADAIRIPEFSGNETVKELLEAREIVELGAMNFIIGNATADEIRKMESIVDKMESSLDTVKDDVYAKMDLEFHRLLIKASNNRFLVQIFESLGSYTEQFMTEGFSIVPNMREKAITEHRRILTALKKNDADLAYQEMMQHVRLRRRIFGPFLKNENKQPKRSVSKNAL